MHCGVVNMRTVIRGAATIEEYKEIKSQMEQLASCLSERHHRPEKKWRHGEPVIVRSTYDGKYAVTYEDGTERIYDRKGERIL